LGRGLASPDAKSGGSSLPALALAVIAEVPHLPRANLMHPDRSVEAVTRLTWPVLLIERSVGRRGWAGAQRQATGRVVYRLVVCALRAGCSFQALSPT